MTGSVDKISIQTSAQPYDVLIAPNLLRQSAIWSPHARNGRLVVVADAEVWNLHGAAIGSAIESAGIAPTIIARTGGEEAKSWTALEALLDELLDLKLERGEPVVALGGGTVGDLAGFAAAVLKRGCPVVQAPTTLLAQVDSAIGGKTGINTRQGKNLVGAFHQPAAVIVDTRILDTLPARHMRNGMAEVVKYGLVTDADFFEWCETHAEAVVAREEAALREAVSACVRIKASMVAGDERDQDGRRALLNFGHSFAHAIEAEAGFSDRVLHGEAVSVGMMLALNLSVQLGLVSAELPERCERLLRSSGLPTRLHALVPDITAAQMVDRMRSDKKVASGALALVLVKQLGRAFVSTGISDGQLTDFIDRAMEEEPS